MFLNIFMFILTSTHVQHYTKSGPFLNNESMQNWDVLMGMYKSLIRYVNKSKIELTYEFFLFAT